MEENIGSITEQTVLSRRDFLKGCGVLAGAALLPDMNQISKNLYDRELSNQAEDTLTESAKSFISHDYKSAIEVSRALRGPGSDPSNICGPLSMAIMMDWRYSHDNGDITQGSKPKVDGVLPSEFWLASPAKDASNHICIDRAFPEDEFDNFHIKGNIGYLDFDNLPDVGKLQPGDFLYLDGGSFTHWVTVSRRGANGELYATTNIPSEKEKEFVISEVELWNPKTKDGFFRNWSSGVGPEKAYTGREGFYLWRRKSEEIETLSDPISEKYRNIFLEKLRNQEKGVWNIVISDLTKGQLFEWRNADTYHPASTIKVPVSIAMMKSIESVYGSEITEKGWEQVLKDHGVSGRSFNQLLSAMLINSEEVATQDCVNYINSIEPISSRFKDMGLSETMYSPRTSSQRDLYKCWYDLLTEESLDSGGTKYLLKLLGTFTDNDDIMLGKIRKYIPEATQWNKRGEVMEQGLFTMQDTGIIGVDGSLYYLGIAGNSLANKTATDKELVDFIEDIAETFSSYIKEKRMVAISRNRNIAQPR